MSYKGSTYQGKPMTAPISVVIPTFNAQSALERSLVPLVAGVSAGVIRELILTDGGSTDHTRDIAKQVGAVWVEGEPSRGGQIARGIAAASGAWVFVIHADSLLQDDWVDVCCAVLSDDTTAQYFDLQFDEPGIMPWIVARWVAIRSRVFGLPYGDQAILISRAHLDRIGGYPDLPLMEDVALARRLAGALRPIGSPLTTSADKYRRRGWMRQGTRNISMLLRYLAGADARALYQRYYR
jgi:rSAM/selenodomain-associated transferase 2